MVALPIWNDAYATGDSRIDEQHRQLLGLVKELEDADLATDEFRAILPYLDRVMDFTLSHFDMEEALMTRVDYPAPDHVEMTEQHSEFVNYARLRVLEFRFGQASDLGQFAPYLHYWLTDHEFGLDRKLANYIRATNQMGASHSGAR